MTGTANHSEDSQNLLLAPVREGETVGGKYVAGQVLGLGGMGIVVLATDKVLERKVAIKFLLPRLASSNTAVQRFIREARAAARITSEHVVRLLEIDELPTGMPYFVMEYLEGKDLRAILADGGPIPAVQAVDYVLQAVQAIAEGHTRGIVHRDLKPSNLFVTYRADRTPLIKVLDFGIAKSLEPERADESRLTGSDDAWLGSPAYMSPEQLRSPSEVDLRTDIWGLGVTLYELVSGAQPFQGYTYADLVLRISNGPPDPLKQHSPDVAIPDGLEAVIRHCLERDKSRRFANALELATALAPFGSEDARSSLRRVKGLADAPPASPPPPIPSDEPAGACTTTLHIPAQAAALPEQSSSQRKARRRAGLLALALCAGAGIVAVVVMVASSGGTADDSVANRPASDVIVPKRPAAIPATAAPAPAASESKSEAVQPNRDPGPAPIAPPGTPAREAIASAPARSSKRPTSDAMPPSAKPTVAASTPAATRVAAPSDPGNRSPEIERLIEQRR